MKVIFRDFSSFVCRDRVVECDTVPAVGDEIAFHDRRPFNAFIQGEPASRWVVVSREFRVSADAAHGSYVVTEVVVMLGEPPAAKPAPGLIGRIFGSS